MSLSPVEQIETVSDTTQTADETIGEYVRRIGDTHDLEHPLIEDALAYVTEYYYSDETPTNHDEFHQFLAAVGDMSRLPETPAAEDSDDDDTTASSGPVVEPQTDLTPATLARFRTGLQGRDPRRLFIRFFVIIATAPVIGWLFARAWVPGNTLYDDGRALLVDILGLPGPDATKLFVIFSFGLYLGLLVLFTLDIKKRVQSMLLWLGTGLVIVAAAVLGWVLPRLEATPLNLLGFTLGIISGIALEADQLRQIDWRRSSFTRPTLSNGAVAEFRYAAWLLIGVLAVAVIATVAQVALAGTLRLFDPIVAGVFLFVVVQFVGYESETSYITLGPERSGKSMLMLGLALTLVKAGSRSPKPNDYLQSSLERASNLRPGQEQWPIPSTAPDELRTASFEVISGSYFSRRLELTALDYAGQHLPRIAELINAETDAADPSGTVPQQVLSRITQTDTILFILDVERLVYPEVFQEDSAADEAAISWGLEHYTTIVEDIDPDDTIVVATKCDILVDAGRVDPPSSYDSFAGFQQAVTDHLTARPDVEELLATTGESTIHPVYYVTERRGGSYVPYLDADGNLVPVGYGHLIEEMKSRQ